MRKLRFALLISVFTLAVVWGVALMSVRDTTMAAPDTPAFPELSTSSSPEDILLALDLAHHQYQRLHAQITTSGEDTVTENEIWLSQPDGTFRQEVHSRQLSTDQTASPSVRTSDGSFTRFSSSGISDQPVVLLAVQPEEAVVPPAASRAENLIYPSWINATLGGAGTPLSPTILAQGKLRSAAIQVIRQDVLLGRDILLVEAKYSVEPIVATLWIDMKSGVLLKWEERAASGDLIFTETIDFIEFDPVFDNADELFFVDQSAYDPAALRDLMPAPPSQP